MKLLPHPSRQYRGIARRIHYLPVGKNRGHRSLVKRANWRAVTDERYIVSGKPRRALSLRAWCLWAYAGMTYAESVVAWNRK